MMKYKCLVSTLLLVLWAGLSVQAQTVENTPVTPKTWSLSIEQAKEYAVKHNRMMKGAELAVQQAELSRWSAIANYLPQASASVDYQSYLSSDSINLGLYKIAMVPTSNLTIQVSQALLNMNVLVGIKISEIAKELTETSLEQAALTIKQNVTGIYYTILVSQESLEILKANYDNVKALAKATRLKVDVGIGEETDADKMDITLGNLENSMKSTERNIELAMNSLHLLLGVDPGDHLVLTSPLDELTNTTSMLTLMVEPFNLSDNVDIRSSELNLALSEKQLESSKASLLPTISAVYQRKEKLLKGNLDFTMKNTLVLTASVPLFTGGRNASNVKKAKLALESSRLDYEQSRDQMLVQEKQLRYNLKNAMETYELQKKNLEISQRIFEKTSKKFEQGLASSLEVSIANNDLLVTQSSYVSATLTLLNAQDALQKLLGKI